MVLLLNSRTSPVVVILCLVAVVFSQRLFCPPPKFIPNDRRAVQGYKTALMFEVHGNVFVSQSDGPLYWTEFFTGVGLSRNIYNHVGILGIDKVYISAFYNQSHYPDTPPTVEDIYPPDKFCVSDWNKLGVIGWRPQPFGGPRETWPLNAKGKPSLDKNLYKTYRGSNLIYDEIKNETDFIFLLDVDEFLVPVNFNASISGHVWCRQGFPPLISTILQQILITATSSRLDNYKMMNITRNRNIIPLHAACMMGYSHSNRTKRCTPIESIYFPSYVWLRDKKSTASAIPTVRSKYPGNYAEYLNSEDHDGPEQLWKSVFQVKYNPPMRTMALHDNPEGKFRILAPRSYHGRLSLEISHMRRKNYFRNATSAVHSLMRDMKLVSLYDSYQRCTDSLKRQQEVRHNTN